MDFVLTISLAEWMLLSSLLSVTLAFLLYWLPIHSARFKEILVSWKPSMALPLDWVNFTKIWGFLCFIGVPVIIFGVVPKGEGWNVLVSAISPISTNVFGFFVWICAMGLPAIMLAYFSGKKSTVQVKYPEAKLDTWSIKAAFNYGCAWLLYLIGYEILFRGVLFVIPSAYLGLPVAIALNISLYSISHIPKGADEAIVAIPVGVLLCIATWQTGSIWAAVAIHVMMAWSGNYFAWKHAVVKK